MNKQEADKRLRTAVDDAAASIRLGQWEAIDAS
jgi:hypothetical protein